MASRSPASTRGWRRSGCSSEPGRAGPGAAAAAPGIARSVGPALGLGHEEVAKRLDARDRAHLLGVDEVALQARHLAVAQDLDQTVVAVDGVVRQDADARSGLHREVQ